jgi:hypothetical protein
VGTHWLVHLSSIVLITEVAVVVAVLVVVLVAVVVDVAVAVEVTGAGVQATARDVMSIAILTTKTRKIQ